MTDSLITVDSFAYFADAATAKALLEEAGVRVFLDNVYSSDLWTGCIGQIRVQVASADAAAARKLLEEIRAANRISARRPLAAAPAESCLRCGQPLAAEVERCARCGFAFSGEEQADYANGPVPDSLLPHAYSPIDTRRFGLRPDLVPRYVEFCAREGYEIDGWQMWAHSSIGHVVTDIVEKGPASALLAAAAKVPPDRVWDTYFSMNVRRLASAEAAE